MPGLRDVDDAALVPAVPDAAPERTRAYKLMMSLQMHDSLRVLAFINTTVRSARPSSHVPLC